MAAKVNGPPSSAPSTSSFHVDGSKSSSSIPISPLGFGSRASMGEKVGARWRGLNTTRSIRSLNSRTRRSGRDNWLSCGAVLSQRQPPNPAAAATPPIRKPRRVLRRISRSILSIDGLLNRTLGGGFRCQGLDRRMFLHGSFFHSRRFNRESRHSRLLNRNHLKAGHHRPEIVPPRANDLSDMHHEKRAIPDSQPKMEKARHGIPAHQAGQPRKLNRLINHDARKQRAEAHQNDRRIDDLLRAVELAHGRRIFANPKLVQRDVNG